MSNSEQYESGYAFGYSSPNMEASLEEQQLHRGNSGGNEHDDLGFGTFCMTSHDIVVKRNTC